MTDDRTGNRGEPANGVETRVDLHVKLLDEAVVERAKTRGLDVLVYAPHFRRLPAIRERATALSDDELLVVPGREIFTGSWRNRKHVLALGLEAPVPDFLSLGGTMAELERQEATVLVPHPGFLNVSLGVADVRRHRDQLAGVEVYNPKHLARHDRGALALAREVDLRGFGSSYAHRRETVGEVWTTFDRPIGSERDLLAALESCAPRTVDYRTGPRHRLRRLAEQAHLGWENTVEKVDRFLRPGRVATHPANPAYGGRFDDAAVY